RADGESAHDAALLRRPLRYPCVPHWPRPHPLPACPHLGRRARDTAVASTTGHRPRAAHSALPGPARPGEEHRGTLRPPGDTERPPADPADRGRRAPPRTAPGPRPPLPRPPTHRLRRKRAALAGPRVLPPGRRLRQRFAQRNPRPHLHRGTGHRPTRTVPARPFPARGHHRRRERLAVR